MVSGNRIAALAFVALLSPLVRTCPASTAVGDAQLDRQIDRGEYIDALSPSVRLFEERLARSGPRSAETLDALHRVAVTLFKMRDLELADAVWRLYRDAAYDAFGPCDPRVAEAIYQNGAIARSVARNYDDALPYYVEALTLLDANNPDHQTLIGRIQKGQANYFRYRDKGKSLALFEASLATLERALPESAWECAETRTWLGWTLLHMGRHDEAQIHLARARGELIALGREGHDLVGTIDAALSDLDVLAGQWASAEEGYLRATQLFERTRRNGSTRFAEFPPHGYNLLALTQLKQGRSDEAWESLQRYRGPVGKRLENLRVWKERSPATHGAVVAARATVLEKRALRWQKPPVVAVDWDAVAAELRANARLCELEARYQASFVPGGASLRELQASLADDWAYVGWLDARVGNELLCSPGQILDSRWMYIVRSQGPIRWIPLWEYNDHRSYYDARHLAGDFSFIVTRAASWALRVEEDRELAELARRVSAQEFNKALPYLRDVRHIVFEYCDDETGWRPLESYLLPDGAYLGERFTVSYSSSANMFVSARRRAEHRPGAAPVIIAFGDAVFSEHTDAPVSSGINFSHHRTALGSTIHRAATNGDPAALARLPRLPYAAAELDRIGALYPEAIILKKQDASERNLRKLFMTPDALRIDIVHVATHVLSETMVRTRCAVALSRGDVGASLSNDGLLDALEIQLGWTLDADLVCLSGCQTASGAAWLRGEPMGLSTVLLGVGARSVLASLWKVDDLATARLMERFYENLSGKYPGTRAGLTGRAMSKATALAEAKHWLRRYTDADRRQPFAHPVYWAGFTLIGDPD